MENTIDIESIEKNLYPPEINIELSNFENIKNNDSFKYKNTLDENDSNSTLSNHNEMNNNIQNNNNNIDLNNNNNDINLINNSNEKKNGFFDNFIHNITGLFNKEDNNIIKSNGENDIKINTVESNLEYLDENNIDKKSTNTDSLRKTSINTYIDKNRISRYLNFFSNDCKDTVCQTDYLDDKGYLKTYKEYYENNKNKLTEAEYLDRIASEINYNNGKVCQTTYTRSSDVYNYLIILKKKDFVKNIYGKSRKDNIRKLENKMSGNLHIGLNTVDMCECHFKEYVVKNLIQTNQLYIQLPKEKSYVLANIWSLEYTKSQINEFIEILALLGASDISYKITNNEYAKIKKKGTLKTGLERFGVITEAEHETINSDKNIFEGNIKFKNNTNKFQNISQFYEHVKKYSDSFSYLNKKADWRDIIKNRFNSNTTYYQFAFGNDHIEDNDFDVSLHFKKIGISYDSEKLNHNNFTTIFNITFEEF